MSLRARLLVGLVVLVAAGLAVAAFATYAAQRSFLYNRVDQQAASVAAQVGSGGGPGGGPEGGEPGGNDGGPGRAAPPSNTIVEHVNAAGKPLSRSLLFG